MFNVLYIVAVCLLCIQVRLQKQRKKTSVIMGLLQQLYSSLLPFFYFLICIVFVQIKIQSLESVHNLNTVY